MCLLPLLELNPHLPSSMA